MNKDKGAKALLAKWVILIENTLQNVEQNTKVNRKITIKFKSHKKIFI